MEKRGDAIRRAIVIAAVWRGALCIAALVCFLAPWVEEDPFLYKAGGLVLTEPHVRLTGIELLAGERGRLQRWCCVATAVGLVVLLGWQDLLLRRLKRREVPATSAEVFHFLSTSMIVEGIGLGLWQAGLFDLIEWVRIDVSVGPVVSLACWILVLLHTVVGLPRGLVRACRGEPEARTSERDPVRIALDRLARWSLALAMLAIGTWFLPWEARSTRIILPYWGGDPVLLMSRWRWRWILLVADIGDFVKSWLVFGGILLILWWSLWSVQRSRFRSAHPVTHARAFLAWIAWSAVTLTGLAAWSPICGALYRRTEVFAGQWLCAVCFFLCATLVLVFSPAMMWRAFRLRARQELQEYLQEAR